VTLWSRVRSWWGATLRRSRMESEMDAELRFHMETYAEDLMRGGAPREEALRRAQLEFGGIERVKEEGREARGGKIMETLLQDLRYGVRMLRKNAAFSIVAVLTLALGIGANSCIFSAVEAVLLRPLPYKDSSRLVVIWADLHRRNGPVHEWTNAADFYDWRAQNKTFEEMALFDVWGPTLTGKGEPVLLNGAAVTYSMFSTLGVAPALGRDFTQEDDRPKGPHVVLLSDGLWRRLYNASSSVLGQTMNLDGTGYTIIGVMPRGFEPPIVPNRDIWTALQARPDDRGNAVVRAIGRLRSRVSIAQAQSEMDTIASRLEQTYPRDNSGVGVSLVPLQEQIAGDVRKPLLVLLGSVALVLLIACANVANLLLARAASRQKEMTLRTALGAGRARVIRQLLTESCLLALLGGTLGLLLAYWGATAVSRALPPAITSLAPARLNLPVLAFTVAVSILTGFIFGMVPAWQATRTKLSESLKESARGAGGKSRHRWRSALVVADVALALALSVGAGLLLKSFTKLTSVDLGFRSDHLLEVRLFLPDTAYPDIAKVTSFYTQLLDRLKELPAVTSASAISTPPLGGPGSATDAGFFIEGRPAPPPGQRMTAWYSIVAPIFYETMKIRLLRGRTFTAQDTMSKAPVVVVNETLAKRYWPNEDPLGKRIAFGSPGKPDPTWREIIGVVGNVKYFSLDEEQPPALYLAMAQTPQRGMTMVVRTSVPPLTLASGMREEINALESNLAVPAFATMDEAVSSAADQPRLLSALTGAFALMALMLAGVGLYGVMAYMVQERTQEMGIRMAIGAMPSQVLLMMLGQGIKLALLGVGVGLAAAVALTRVLGSLLFEVGDRDPATFVSVALLLIGVAFAASYFPARRAMRVDPIVALRYE
jgi:putative ABC transport system permease protein